MLVWPIKKGEFLFAYRCFLTMVGDLTVSTCPSREASPLSLGPALSGLSHLAGVPASFLFHLGWLEVSEMPGLQEASCLWLCQSMEVKVMAHEACLAWVGGMPTQGSHSPNEFWEPMLPLCFKATTESWGCRSGIVCLTRMCKAWVPPWPLKKKNKDFIDKRMTWSIF